MKPTILWSTYNAYYDGFINIKSMDFITPFEFEFNKDEGNNNKKFAGRKLQTKKNIF